MIVVLVPNASVPPAPGTASSPTWSSIDSRTWIRRASIPARPGSSAGDGA